MTQPLVSRIASAAGLPSSMRVGLVRQTDPLIVSVQGVNYAAESVGIVEPGPPADGQPMALIGQAGLQGGDPTTWLALGTVRPATAGTPATVSEFYSPSENTASLTYVSFTTPVWVSFTAPSTGRVLLHYRGLVTATAGQTALVAPQVQEGDVLGSGDVAFIAADNYSLSTPLTTPLSLSASTLVEGLAAYALYHAVLMIRTTGGTAAASRKEIIVAPAA